MSANRMGKTLIDQVRAGDIPPQVRRVADEEGVSPGELADRVARGEVVIPQNVNHTHIKPCGIGKGLRTKVNANIGTSPDFPGLEGELKKLKAAISAGADTVMDLSTGGDLDRIRRAILKESTVPVGSVPIYQAAVEVTRSGRPLRRMTPDDLFSAIERHCADGMDFITVHCGLTRSALERLIEGGRVMDVVSRGGSFIVGWMLQNDAENPLYEHFDRLIEIARRYDVTLSLGDGMRPGCLADATDRPQVEELIVLGELQRRALEAGVQVMIEGPGHLPLNEVEANVLMEKKLCNNAPFYVLGPIVTDIAPGYDHLVSAIGGAMAAAAGADFLCYVTPSEHLGLPDVDEVRQGVIAARIAAHIADIAKGIKGAMEWDLEMAKARKRLDWKRQIELAIDPEMADKIRESKPSSESDVCSMCGEFCAVKNLNRFLEFIGRKRSE
jgi:phosphomethylpyrimidine synthase